MEIVKKSGRATRSRQMREELPSATKNINPEGDETPSVRLGILEKALGFNLRIAQTAVFQDFASLAGEVDLAPGRFVVLEVIAGNPGITQTALGRANGRDKSSLTPVLDDLVRRGLVWRHRCETNRRAYTLELTPAGETMRTQLEVIILQHESTLEHILGHADYRTLVNLLQKLTNGLSVNK